MKQLHLKLWLKCNDNTIEYCFMKPKVSYDEIYLKIHELLKGVNIKQKIEVTIGY